MLLSSEYHHNDACIRAGLRGNALANQLQEALCCCSDIISYETVHAWLICQGFEAGFEGRGLTRLLMMVMIAFLLKMNKGLKLCAVKQ